MILCRLKFTGAGLEKDRIQPYPLALILFSSGLIVFTNSRIYLPLLLIYYFLLLCEYRDLPVQKLFRLRYVAALLALGILGMVLLTFIPKWFPQLHWIGLNFEDGILTGSNTQGRNQIWRNVLGYFFEAPWGRRLFGVDLVSTPGSLGAGLAFPQFLRVYSLFFRLYRHRGFSGVFCVYSSDHLPVPQRVPLLYPAADGSVFWGDLFFPGQHHLHAADSLPVYGACRG